VTKALGRERRTATAKMKPSGPTVTACGQPAATRISDLCAGDDDGRELAVCGQTPRRLSPITHNLVGERALRKVARAWAQRRGARIRFSPEGRNANPSVPATIPRLEWRKHPPHGMSLTGAKPIYRVPKYQSAHIQPFSPRVVLPLVNGARA